MDERVVADWLRGRLWILGRYLVFGFIDRKLCKETVQNLIVSTGSAVGGRRGET